MTWKNFVALGDSFTEGMDDAYPDGSYRGGPTWSPPAWPSTIRPSGSWAPPVPT